MKFFFKNLACLMVVTGVSTASAISCTSNTPLNKGGGLVKPPHRHALKS